MVSYIFSEENDLTGASCMDVSFAATGFCAMPRVEPHEEKFLDYRSDAVYIAASSFVRCTLSVTIPEC